MATPSPAPNSPINGASQIMETAFEKKRGISDVEVRPGFTQVHVTRVPGDLVDGRMAVLDAVEKVHVSIDFLKMSNTGLSFLVSQDSADRIRVAFSGLDCDFDLVQDRAIVLVHAVNMRDEEGMIAGIVRRAIRTGAPVEHVTDMHDRMLLVMAHSDALAFETSLEAEIETELQATGTEFVGGVAHV